VARSHFAANTPMTYANLEVNKVASNK
jgi:hypothetical protein